MTEPQESERPLRLGTRGSALARWQAEWIAQRLQERGVAVEIQLISTQGDVRSGPIGSLGEQGVFTKEIQRALLDHEIDLAVHSLKDLPTEPVDGLTLAAVPAREGVRDALVCNQASCLEELPQGAKIGSGSTRRRSQLLHLRPDLEILDIRGNVDSRLKKLDEGQYDAIILAEAGLRRLGWKDRIAHAFAPQFLLPAVGQGALGVEARQDDEATLEKLSLLNDASSKAAVLAERAMLAALRGGCLAPVGAWGRAEGEKLRLDGAVLSLDGRDKLMVSQQSDPGDCETLGREVAEKLLKIGAAELIAASRG